MSKATFSTAPLAQRAAHFEHLSVAVVHNHVDPGFAGVARMLRESRPWGSRPFAFGYFSSGAGHDLDLQMIVPALVQTLRADPALRLLLVGPIAIPEELQSYAARIRHVGVLASHALPLAMAQCRKVIAPLEDSAFNGCKSGVRFVEAALVGCQVLATPIADIDRFRSPLLLRCTTMADWSASLLSGDALRAEDAERWARELEAEVQIEAAVPGWLQAVGLALA